MRKILAPLAASIVLFSTSSIAVGEESAVASFYKDKTVQILVGYSAGGGYDTYARTLARYIGEKIPGNPNVIVKNVPGAGSLVLMNQIANTLPRDGTVFGTVARGAAFEPLFGNEQALFKPQELNWLGSLNDEMGMCAAWHTADVKTLEDLREHELLVGGTGAGADTDTFPRVLAEVLDFKFNLASGYPGSSEINLAMERGEIEGHCSGGWTGVKTSWAPWIEEGKLNPLFILSRSKHPELPEVPLIMDLAENDYQKQVLQLMLARQVMGRPYVAPPGIPADRLVALQKAFEATASDPEFLAEAERKQLEISFVSAADITEVVRESYRASPEVVQVIKDAKHVNR
ncbi:Bug family tripartite tricarboxylate transporter substrate binding protein [Marinobacter sp. BSs20148]|jgi:tripartite-type tricarboxylate transporter receptor subunit TctC|uniref:Bug family tripartite tricarboxylate transporter substrate binding protein n=1 Tax=Marinobacter sp. BSs20148 TaxID=490759 RepID=UPI00030D4BD4|nr:tripartite tricarboxylate transporter substrate-binding protein [Marinobacter sp. BSs20148]